MNYAEESLKLHEQWKGKIEVIAKVPVATKDDLSLAYTPGVAHGEDTTGQWGHDKIITAPPPLRCLTGSAPPL